MRWGQTLSIDENGTPVRPKWGTDILWGQSDTITNTLTWAIEVDWDNDGLFDGSNEMPYCFDISVRRGRKFFLNSSGTGFQPVDIGEASIQLNNRDGRFDAYNSSSPLYGLLVPGRLFRLRVKRESDNTIKNVFFGHIIDIRPSYGDVDTVTIIVQDDIALLRNSTVRTAVYSSVRYNSAIDYILSAANWQYGSNISDTITDSMSYWWASGNSVFDEINSITDATLGIFYIAANGEAIYLDRINSSTPTLEIDDSDWMRNYKIRSPQPWETVKNSVRVFARTRTLQSSVEIWRMSDTPSIGASESITVWATFSYNSQTIPVTSIVTPVETTDYTGSVNTSDISISITLFSTSAKIIITNNNASSQVLTLMKIRGNAIIPDQYTFLEDSDPESIVNNGTREFEIKNDWIQDTNTASDYSRLLLIRLADPRQFPRIMLKGNPDKQFDIDLFDIHTLNLTMKNINAQLRVGYLEQKSVSKNLDLFETTIYYEPNMAGETSGTWIFPATFGVTTVF